MEDSEILAVYITAATCREHQKTSVLYLPGDARKRMLALQRAVGGLFTSVDRGIHTWYVADDMGDSGLNVVANLITGIRLHGDVVLVGNAGHCEDCSLSPEVVSLLVNDWKQEPCLSSAEEIDLDSDDDDDFPLSDFQPEPF